MMNYKSRLVRVLSITIICFAMQTRETTANNVAVSNLSLAPVNMAGKYTYVQFDIRWDNSWRTSTKESNYDAAWTFVKYRLDGTNWNHATLATSGHKAPSGGMITAASDGRGAFIYRDSDGIGDVNYTWVQLRWNYGDDGLDLQKGDSVALCAFTIEMVYIPQASFYVGGDNISSPVRGPFEAGTNGNPFQITNEAAFTLGGGGAGSLGNNNAIGMFTADDFNDTTSVTLPAAFPKGYNAFYCMKYEISQGQYADFLNKLTDTQDNARYPNKIDWRHTISGSYTNYTASARDRACNYLNWPDLAAYADWAGLRPMTELEYEKACRGTESVETWQFAWGTNSAYGSQYYLANDGQPNAVITNLGVGTGNASYSSTDGTLNGPLRCGIFAASSTNGSRWESGATYYGLMEMAGNVNEHVVTVGNSTGRWFTASHGDGALSSDGYASGATVTNWPGYSIGTGKIDGVNGAGIRGDGCYYDGNGMRISDRYMAALGYADRFYSWGGRLVRSAP